MREEEKKKSEKKTHAKTEKKSVAKKEPKGKKETGSKAAGRKNRHGKEAVETKKSPAEKKIRSEKKKLPAMKKSAPVRIIPLGGLGEIGKNMTVVETDESMIVIDCGMGFPDDGMPGVDLVIPDTAYLEENIHKIRGIFLTHGHEDHIGAIPYVLRKVNVPLFGTKLTLGIVENKLVEFGLDKEADLRKVRAGETVRAGDFDVEFISVNHSIADAVAFAIHSPAGTLVFTGDFKIDSTPIAGEMTDLTRFGELGREGITALFCDSTNCERAGFTPSERTVGTSLEHIFHDNQKRVIVATFSSNIHRVQQIIDASVKHQRAVCILGRSMINIVNTASTLGYMKIPQGTLIEPEELKKFAPRNVTLITTGSQGEAMSALSRMAYGTHSQVKLSPEDMVVISAHPIPGNEKTITNIINELMKKKVSVVYDQTAEVHVSGHACQEEIKMIFALTKPRFFMPVHGEYKHLARNAALAEYAGISKENIFISDIGKVLEISGDGTSARFAGNVPAGKIMVDGLGVGDVGSVVLRDRKLLSEEGIITVVAAVDNYGKFLVSEVQIITRGFVYVRENEDLMEEIRTVAARTIENALAAGLDLASVKSRSKDEIGKFLFGRTRRRPLILTVLIET
ncbi:MAG: RNase J family beta-CASP ribonuclease [Clostridia bacterium]|nr:RNase J family beta-CASP ribonuclease [Clostridia bacterium]